MHQRDVRLHSYATFGALGSGAQGAGLLSENKRSAAPPEFATIHKLCLTAANNFHQISSSVLINHWWIGHIRGVNPSMQCLLSLVSTRDSLLQYELWTVPLIASYLYGVGSIWKGQHKRCIKGCKVAAFGDFSGKQLDFAWSPRHAGLAPLDMVQLGEKLTLETNRQLPPPLSSYSQHIFGGLHFYKVILNEAISVRLEDVYQHLANVKCSIYLLLVSVKFQ